MLPLFLTALLVCGSLAARAQTSGTVDPIFNTTSLDLVGYGVQAVAIQPDGKILVAGGATGIARLNADGSVDTSFTGSVSTVNQQSVSAVAVQNDGKIVLAGNFSMVDGASQAGIARLNSDGSLDTGFAVTFGTNHTVSSVAIQADGKIVLGGGFNTVDGATHKTIARLNGDGSLDSTFTPSTDGGVNSLAIQADGKIVLGGSFTHVNGASLNVARLNGDGSLDTSFTASIYGGYLLSLIIQADGKIVLGGSFSTVNGVAQPSIARLNGDGSLDPSFAATTDTATLFRGVYSLAIQNDGKIVLGGGFSMVNGVTQPSIARLNSDGSLDTSFTASIASSNLVQSVAIQADGKVVLGGVFKTVDGVTCNCLARVYQSGGLDPSFLVDIAPGPNSGVSTQCVQADGKMLLGGGFTQVNGISHPYIARLNSDGSLDTSFTASTNLGGVQSLAIQADGKIVLGGGFSTVNGAAHSSVARLNGDGSLDTSFTANTDGHVYTLAIQADGKIVLGGSFTHVNGMPLNHVARLNGDGSLDTSFTTTTGSAGFGVFSLAIQADGKIVLGGSFTMVNGTLLNYVARLNSDGSLDTSFTTSISGYSFGVRSLAIQADGKIVLGGFFTAINGASHSHIARLNSDGSLDPSFAANTDSGSSSVVYGLAIQNDGKIVLAGNFQQVDGAAHPYFSRLNGDGSLDTSFTASTDNGALSVAIQADGTFVLTGNFNQVNGVTRNYVARLNADGSVDNSFIPGFGVPKTMALSVQPSATDPSDVSALQVIVGGAFSYLGGQPVNALARLQSDGSKDRSFNPTFQSTETVQSLAVRPIGTLGASDAGAVITASLGGTGTGGGSAVTTQSMRRGGAARGSAPAGVRPLRPILPPYTSTKITNPIRPCSLTDGSFDGSFNNGNGAGTDGVTNCLALQGSTNRILIAGSFTALNGGATGSNPNLGRLMADGTLDNTFLGANGAPVQTDAAVLALAIQPADAASVIGGSFTHVNGLASTSYLTRLTFAGALDLNFQAALGSGPNAPVTALLVQTTDAKIVAGGTFTVVGGAARPNLARLSTSGSLDTSFASGAFATGLNADGSQDAVAIGAITQQPQDGRLIVVGRFDTVAGVSRHNRVRLNTDGSVDSSYGAEDSSSGGGPNGLVNAVGLQPDGKALLGGDFTQVDGLERAAAARLLGDQLNPLEDWRLLNFGTIDPYDPIGGDLAAPFGDGVSNLLKYALNMNALGADRTVMTAQGTAGLPLLGRDAGNHLTLTFVERLPSTSPGITYAVVFGASLTGGFAVNPSATTTTTAIDNTWQRVTVTDSMVMGTPGQARYAYLQVTDSQ